jgi:ABC-type lipoprotein release transport system permease subunit
MNTAGSRQRDRGLPGMLRLAWRSLGRQRRRTALLIVVVAYATVSLLFFWGLTDGFLTSIYQSQARLLGAPVLVTTPAYHADPDPVHALPELEPLVEAARSIDTVQAVAARVDVPVLLRSPYASTGVQLRGIEPTAESRVSELPGAIGEGRMVASAGEIVLGDALAERIDVRIGERVAVDAASVAGPSALGLRLVGLIHSDITVVDETTALVHIDDARTLAGIDTATSLALGVPIGREAAAARALNERLSDTARAYGVEAQMGELARGLAAERVGAGVMGIVFAVFAAVAVTSSVVVSVMERTREFGVMLALGMSHRRLGVMVTLEAVLAALVGYAVGLVIGYGLLIWMAQVNVLGPLFAGIWGDLLSGLALGTDIRTDVRLVYVAYAGATVVLAALGAILTPARRVQALVPAEAMRAAD